MFADKWDEIRMEGDNVSLAMLNISATQQIKKELDAVKAENESLKTLVKQFAEKDQARDARLIAIEKQLAPSGGPEVQTVSLGAGGR